MRNRQNKFFYEPDDRELFVKSLRTTRMFMRWIDGENFNDLSHYAPAGIIKRNAETLSWIIKGFARIIKSINQDDNELVEFVLELSDRILFGVPSKAIEVIKMRIPGIGRQRSIDLVNNEYTKDWLLSNKISYEEKLKNLSKIKGIGERLATRILEYTEKYIDNELERYKRSQRRRAKQLGKDESFIEKLYSEEGNAFSQTVTEIFKLMDLDAAHVDQQGSHNVDVVITTEYGKIVIECKRKKKGCVSATEAEEIRGKGARYNPIAYVTVGHPCFSDDAMKNSFNTKITMFEAFKLGEMLIRYWNDEFNKDDIISILKYGRYIHRLADIKEPSTLA